jgi:hypothetical protein
MYLCECVLCFCFQAADKMNYSRTQQVVVRSTVLVTG